MVYNTQGCWLLGLCPSSAVLKNSAFRKLDLFPSAGEELGDTLLGRLEKANHCPVIEVNSF
jgi:hypothetical protein